MRNLALGGEPSEDSDFIHGGSRLGISGVLRKLGLALFTPLFVECCRRLVELKFGAEVVE